MLEDQYLLVFGEQISVRVAASNMLGQGQWSELNQEIVVKTVP
jgi:hypothetical protein